MMRNRFAYVIAVIVALADAVIIYDMWVAGTWLSPSFLSAAKTTAFILIFIGALIAEMQELKASTRLLLFIVVLILGGYQATINAVVNYHAAKVPATAIDFFMRLGMVADDVPFWYAIMDACVRTATVVLMWLVTGLVWRGVATAVKEENQVVKLQKEKGKPNVVVPDKDFFASGNGKISKEEAVPLLVKEIEDAGTINATQFAEEHGVTRQTVSNWVDWAAGQGMIVKLSGRGQYALPETMEVPEF